MPSVQHIVGQYYQFLRLGFSGYKRIISSCAIVARQTADKIEALGSFDVLSVRLSVCQVARARCGRLRTAHHRHLSSPACRFARHAGIHCCANAAVSTWHVWQWAGTPATVIVREKSACMRPHINQDNAALGMCQA